MTTPAARSAPWPVRALALAGAVTVLFLIFLGVVRPWYRNWGATAAEVARALPGDELIPGDANGETRAITIQAPIGKVWPWLAQIGQDRGGFYSFDLLENLVGCEMPAVDSLRPDRQAWQVGDRLWMYPSAKAGGIGFATLRVLIPGQALVFGTHVAGTSPIEPEDGSWGFYLSAVDSSATRFLVRGRGAPGRSLLGVAFDRAVFEPIHFMMERRMLLGLRDVVERGDRRRWANHGQVLVWTLTFVAMVLSGLRVVSRRRWWRPLAGFVAWAIVFQGLTLGQPPLPAAFAAFVLVSAGAWWLEREPS